MLTPTLPVESTKNLEESGFESSSTTIALPVPSWVIRNRSVEVEPSIVVIPLTESSVIEPIPPITLMAVVAVPVKSPTKPPMEVVTPEANKFCTVVNPLTESSVIEPIPPITLMAVVAVPVKSPTKPPIEVVIPEI